MFQIIELFAIFWKNAPKFRPNEDFSWLTILTAAILVLNLSTWTFLLILAWRKRIRCPFCCNCRHIVPDLEIMVFLTVFKT